MCVCVCVRERERERERTAQGLQFLTIQICQGQKERAPLRVCGPGIIPAFVPLCCGAVTGQKCKENGHVLTLECNSGYMVLIR